MQHNKCIDIGSKHKHDKNSLKNCMRQIYIGWTGDVVVAILPLGGNPLLHGHRLGQVPGAVHVAAPQDGQVVRQQLKKIVFMNPV